MNLSHFEFIKPLMALLLSIISFFMSIGGYPVIPNGQKLDMSKFELVWADEFNAKSLDRTNWNGHGFSAGQTIVRRGSYWDIRLAEVKDGALHIATKYYENGPDGNGKPGWYTCGIDTSGSYRQTYGYFEARCILPKGTGMWSAFWMLCESMSNVDGSGTDGAEIDIYESPYYFETGLNKNTVSSAVHYDGYGEGLRSEAVCRSIITNNPYEQFNTYGLEWNSDEYIFYINGVEAGRSSFGGASQTAEYMILSVEVDGANAVPADGWSGPSVNASPEIPTDFIVDYVRAYQYK
ncbi:MAG: glycoside hydrolase family 16 protein [Clostridiales bacterium]|nr:glycoside hydrolase family 16 protein [Clostridiales bacterium]